MKMKAFLILFIMITLFILPMVVALTINNPDEDTTYDSRLILFDLEATEKSTFYYMDNSGPGRWRELCDKKDTCVKRIRASEGNNSFSIKAVDSSGEADIESVEFQVDSKKPRILKTFPLGNSFVNGESLFSVLYSEENLDNIMLFYLTDGTLKDTTLDECESGLNQRCSTSIDLSSYDGKLMDFWFNVSDSVNTVLSRTTRVKVDTTAPKIDEDESSISADGTKVKFILEVEENNFDEATYEEINDCGSKFKTSGRLCNKLVNGRCSVTRKFCKGNHEFKAIVRDKAGNTDEISKSFDLTD